MSNILVNKEYLANFFLKNIPIVLHLSLLIETIYLKHLIITIIIKIKNLIIILMMIMQLEVEVITHQRQRNICKKEF